MNDRLQSRSLASVLAALLGAAPAYGWGESGHRITAEIAERNLSPSACAAVRAIIGDEHLAEIATWPDDIRSDSSWDFAKPWHFLSIADDASFDDYRPDPDGDVLQKLKDFEAFLRSGAETMEVEYTTEKKEEDGTTTTVVESRTIDKRQALAFYVHFAGDIHQPLHVGRAEDYGGNKIQVEWFGDEVNLHSVWDEHLIESTSLSFTELSTFLNRVPEDAARKWQSSGYIEWAQESKDERAKVYDYGAQRNDYYLNVTSAPVLSYDYRAKALPIIRERLKRGGIRLAGKLNDIFAHHEPGEHPLCTHP